MDLTNPFKTLPAKDFNALKNNSKNENFPLE
jgi:hypothetical protein